jgi:hypothetical protein
MTNEQIAHVEEQLIKFIDRTVEKQNTTSAEVQALADIVFALAEIHRI